MIYLSWYVLRSEYETHSIMLELAAWNRHLGKRSSQCARIVANIFFAEVGDFTKLMLVSTCFVFDDIKLGLEL